MYQRRQVSGTACDEYCHRLFQKPNIQRRARHHNDAGNNNADTHLTLAFNILKKSTATWRGTDNRHRLLLRVGSKTTPKRKLCKDQ